MSDDRFAFELHGPEVTIERGIEVADAMKDLLSAAAQHLGVPEEQAKWALASIEFQCDGCGLRRPDRPRPDEGWTHSKGDDFCPTCTQAALPPPKGSSR